MNNLVIYLKCQSKQIFKEEKENVETKENNLH